MFKSLRVGVLSLVAVPLGLAAFSATAEAGTITLHSTQGQGQYTGNSGGGEFGVTAFSGAAVPTSPMVINNVSGLTNTIFQTFCVEGGVGLPLDTSLTWSLSTKVNNDNSKPLHDQTAYLYTQFWNGSLSNPTYVSSLGSGRVSSADDLQQAIWFIEGYWLGSFSSLTSGAQSYVTQANTAVAAGGSWFGKGLGDVRVLVLTDSTGTANYQDVLVLLAVPLPPAALLGLALIGGLGVAGAVRRRRRTFDA
jgi:hypothetical protein